MRASILAVLVLSLAAAAPAQLELPFTEDWYNETDGDNANQLDNWSYQPAYGTAPAGDTPIYDAGGDNVLNMNPGASNSTGLSSDRFDFGATVFSVQADMQLTTDGSGAGVIGFAQYGNPLYGYVLAVSRNGSNAWFDLRRFDGDLNDSFTAGPVSVAIDPTLAHNYKLRALIWGDRIEFSVFLDGSPTKMPFPDLQPIDYAPHDFSGGFSAVLASNFGQQAYFDNIQVIPEPAVMTLLTIGAAALIRSRRR